MPIGVFPDAAAIYHVRGGNFKVLPSIGRKAQLFASFSNLDWIKVGRGSC